MLKKICKIRIRSVHILAVVFLLFIDYVGLAALPQFLENTRSLLQGNNMDSSYIRMVNEQYESMLETKAMYGLLQNKGTYINFNGFMAKLTRQPMMNERITLKNGHLTRIASESPTLENIQRAADTIIRFYNAQTSSGGNFLFIMVPSQISKYDDLLPAGYTDTTNDTADTFLMLLKEAGVPYLDLREELQKDGISITDAYYTTDHHWKPLTGFWAYEKIIKKLEQIGAIEPVDSFYTDAKNYTFITYKNSFLGSSGKRTGVYYSGLDDAVFIYPNFDTEIKISIPSRNLELQGHFEDVAYNNEAAHDYIAPNFFQENFYGLYGWGDTPITHWRNVHAQEQSKFLLIGDSFGNIPFSLMSIIFGSCDEMDSRHYDNDCFSAYYNTYKPDTVILEFSIRNVISEFTEFQYTG